MSRGNNARTIVIGNKKYSLDGDKTTCVVFEKHKDGTTAYTGVAVRKDTDAYDEAYGMDIARLKALKKMYSERIGSLGEKAADHCANAIEELTELVRCAKRMVEELKKDAAVISDHELMLDSTDEEIKAKTKPHDDIANAIEDGAGKLYGLMFGETDTCATIHELAMTLANAKAKIRRR